MARDAASRIPNKQSVFLTKLLRFIIPGYQFRRQFRRKMRRRKTNASEKTEQ